VAGEKRIYNRKEDSEIHMMELETVFGKKDQFAIEVKVNSAIEKSNLRLWICGHPLGYFKREGKLTSSIGNFKKLLFYKDTLYDDIFSSMNPTEIYNWLLGKAKGYEGFKSERLIYVRWMGDQMDEFSMMAYYKDKKFEWIVYDVKKKKVLHYTVEESYLVNAVNEYINWYEKEFGEVKCNYNIFP
jgi:hypothetical protein